VARLQAEEESRQKAAGQAKLQAEERARLQAEEQAKLKAQEEAHRKAEEEARLWAEEETRRKAEVARVLQAEEEASHKAEVQAKLKAEEQAKLKTEEANASVLASSTSEASAQASSQGYYLDDLENMQSKGEAEESIRPASQGSYLDDLAAQDGQDTTPIGASGKARKESPKETTQEKKQMETPEEKTSFWGSLSKLVAAQRRSEDEKAAARARAETQEWEKLQKSLTKEVEQERWRRENKEGTPAEPRTKARKLGQASDPSPKKGGIFSVFDYKKPEEGTVGKSIQEDPPAPRREMCSLYWLVLLGLGRKRSQNKARRKRIKKWTRKDYLSLEDLKRMNRLLLWRCRLRNSSDLRRSVCPVANPASCGQLEM
jgi:hypothetical protein